MNREKKKTVEQRRITFRLSGAEWQKLEGLRKKSNCKTFSSLIRKSLFGGRIRIITYDRSLDKTMEELAGIRKEIQSIGININQVTRRFHQSESQEGRLLSVMDITRLYQQTDQKITELFGIVSKLSERWLPG